MSLYYCSRPDCFIARPHEHSTASSISITYPAPAPDPPWVINYHALSMAYASAQAELAKLRGELAALKATEYACAAKDHEAHCADMAKLRDVADARARERDAAMESAAQNWASVLELRGELAQLRGEVEGHRAGGAWLKAEYERCVASWKREEAGWHEEMGALRQNLGDTRQHRDDLRARLGEAEKRAEEMKGDAGAFPYMRDAFKAAEARADLAEKLANDLNDGAVELERRLGEAVAYIERVAALPTTLGKDGYRLARLEDLATSARAFLAGLAPLTPPVR